MIIFVPFKIDFASRDCQTAFFEKMEKTGQLQKGERPDERAGRFLRTPGTAGFPKYVYPNALMFLGEYPYMSY